MDKLTAKMQDYSYYICVRLTKLFPGFFHALKDFVVIQEHARIKIWQLSDGKIRQIDMR
jgi:hypothetical protein